MIPQWMIYANFALNTLIIPLLLVLWQIKNGLTRLEAVVEGQHERIKRLEQQADNE